MCLYYSTREWLCVYNVTQVVSICYVCVYVWKKNWQIGVFLYSNLNLMKKYSVVITKSPYCPSFLPIFPSDLCSPSLVPYLSLCLSQEINGSVCSKQVSPIQVIWKMENKCLHSRTWHHFHQVWSTEFVWLVLCIRIIRFLLCISET